MRNLFIVHIYMPSTARGLTLVVRPSVLHNVSYVSNSCYFVAQITCLFLLFMFNSISYPLLYSLFLTLCFIYCWFQDDIWIWGCNARNSTWEISQSNTSLPDFWKACPNNLFSSVSTSFPKAFGVEMSCRDSCMLWGLFVWGTALLPRLVGAWKAVLFIIRIYGIWMQWLYTFCWGMHLYRCSAWGIIGLCTKQWRKVLSSEVINYVVCLLLL